MGKPRWRRIMAVGCSHGNRASPALLNQVIAFRKAFRPHLRVHLGDVVDTAAFRHGAAGTSDECEDVALDHGEGIDFLKRYEPTHITWGNHDWRLVKLASDPKAIVRYAASELWRLLNETATKVGAVTAPYRIDKGWFKIGAHHWGHGYWFNVNAVRDTAEYIGGPVVMAHLHRAQMVQGRTRVFSPSFCTGYLGDWDKFDYAHHRRASAEWSHGVVFGEVSDTESRLWLASSENSQPIAFPPGTM